MNKRQNIWLYCISFVTIIVFFQLNLGLRVLIPSNVSWLMTGKSDWNTHYLGWFFFRNEPWQFPLGRIANYFYPLGTNVGFTDSIPLMALLFKLFSPLLSPDFQYFGIWLLLCHILIAYFVIRIGELFRLNAFAIFLMVIFVTENPVLLYRSMHPALCAHWLFLGSTYLYLLEPSQLAPKKALRWQLLLLLLSALITPYLLVIEFGFTLILLWKHLSYERSISWKYAGIQLAVSLAGGVAIWLLTGMLTFGNKEHLAINGGFGKLSMNLNAFYDPSIWSSILHEQKRTSMLQYEGYMYLGVGFFFLLLMLVVYELSAAKKSPANIPATAAKPRVVAAPLTVLCGILAFAAITNTVSFNDKVLFVIPVPAIVTNTGDIFRASGRFFWPVYYLILFWVIIRFVGSRWPASLKMSLLTMALLIQLYDIKFLLTFQQLPHGAYQPPISKQWNAITRHFNKVLLYPPFETDYLAREDYQYFAFIAAGEQKPIDVAYVAREDAQGMNRFKDTLQAHLIEGTIDTGALYITTPANLQAFGPSLLSNKLDLNSLDGYCYLYSRGVSTSDLAPEGDSAQKASAHLKDSLIRAFTSQKREFLPVDSIGRDNDSVSFATGSLVVVNGYVAANGWCYIKGKKNNKGDSLFLCLQSQSRSYRAPLQLVPSPDVTAYFKAENLDDAGFSGSIFEDSVANGSYHLAIAIRERNGKWSYKLMGREVHLDRRDR